MADQKNFPPRTAYSLKEASQLLGCNIDTLLDWGIQGHITICTKITDKTLFGKGKTYYLNPFNFDLPPKQNERYPCIISTKLYKADQFYAGAAYIKMQPEYVKLNLTVKTFPDKRKDALFPDNSEDMSWYGCISGFWELDRAYLFHMSKRDSNLPEDMLITPYGMTEKEYKKKGRCICAAKIALSVDDFFLMNAEFEKLKYQKPKREHEAAGGGLPSRSETTYLNIIGGLLRLFLGESPEGRKLSVYDTQSAVIEAMLAYYPNVPGISKRTLEEKFAEANRQINSN